MSNTKSFQRVWQARKILATAIAAAACLIIVPSQSQSRADSDSKSRQNAKTATEPIDTLRVRIVTESSDPIEGAIITPYGLRAGDTSGHIGWPRGNKAYQEPKETKSDARGIASVEYPRSIGKPGIKIQLVSLRITHPEYVAAVQDVPVMDTPVTIRLARGSVIEVEAKSNDRVVTEDIFGQGGSWPSGPWARPKNGKLRSPRLLAGNATVRAIWLPKDGPAQFTHASPVQIANDNTDERTLDLHPGARLTGKLDDVVPRPIKNGKVIVVVHTPGGMDWQDWTEVKEDGTYEFSSLPHDEGAIAQLIATCDGFVSKPPGWDNATDRSGKPQDVPLSKDSAVHTIEMLPTASVKLLLTEQDGRPIPDVDVSFFPNVHWKDGSTIFAGGLSRSSDVLRDLDASKHAIGLPSRRMYHTKSDEHGIARIDNLPPFSPFGAMIHHEQFQLPATTAPGFAGLPGASRVANMETKPGETIDLEVVLVPTDEAIAEQTVEPTELVGTVLSADGKPMAGVTVDVWTWHPGNETKTDNRGRFRLKGFEPSEHIEVIFRKAGYEPRYFHDQQTGVPNWVVQMDNRTFLEGTMTDPQGKTVANAVIRAERGPFNNEQVVIGEVPTETRTDENGHYRLYLEPATYAIKVRTTDRGVARFEGQTIAVGEQKKFDIQLNDGITFRAKVLNSVTGEPVAGITLWNWQLKGFEGKSNEDGVLEIPGMYAGKFEFNVTGKGSNRMRESVAGDYARWWSEQATEPHQRKETTGGDRFPRNFDDLQFAIAEQAGPVTIYVEPCVTITGRVIDPEGNPVAGATVAPAHTGTGNSITGDTRFSYETKADGSFKMRLPASAPAKYNLIAHDGKYGQWRKWANTVADSIVTQPGDKIENVELRLTRPATIRGRVMVDGKFPAANQEVGAADFDKRDNRYYIPTTKTDADGRFELKFVGPGEQAIAVEWAFLNNDVVPDGPYKVIEVEEGTTIDDVEIELKTQVAAPIPVIFNAAPAPAQ